MLQIQAYNSFKISITFKLCIIYIRNIEKVSNRIFNSQKGPLIGLVLWKNNEPYQVNYTIKNILKLFVDHVSIDFPNGEIYILSVSIKICNVANSLLLRAR